MLLILSYMLLSAQHNDSGDETSTPTPPPIPFSQHPQVLPDDGAQDAATLLTTTHGIRVRDFAYENTLPPVTTVPRFTVQIQPRPRTLKRARDMLASAGRDDGEESDEEDPSIQRTFYIDSSGTGANNTSRYRKKGTLARTLTEPADEQPPPSQGFPRAHVLTQPSRGLRHPSPSRTRQGGAQFPTTPNKAGRRSPQGGLSPINTQPQSQPSMLGDSQESEPYIDTPLVTPNGSLQWPVQNTSTLASSHLESILPQLADPDVTMSQLGFTPERSQRPRVSPGESPPRRSGRNAQLPPPAEFRTRTPTPAKSRPSSGSPVRRVTRSSGSASPAPLQDAPAPRYHLRQRPQSGKAAAPATSRGTSRTRTSDHATQRAEKQPSKRRKLTPPEPATTTVTRGRRKNSAIKENR